MTEQAAVPNYLGSDFSSASPGMRFNMYLAIWNAKFEKAQKGAKALQKACHLTKTDQANMKALQQRQQHLFDSKTTPQNGLVLDAVAIAPFTTGLGNEHPSENGFAFLNPYGLPYLPGSGVKGVLRQAACELASGEWGTSAWTEAHIIALFGQDNPAEESRRGALTFWDVIPQLKGGLAVDVMTPHQKHYYQEGKSPHESGQPIPIYFLTVPPESGFSFYIQCDLALLEKSAPSLLQDAHWKKELLPAAFQHAFQWLGFGAKTSVGYGAMGEDKDKKLEREKNEAQRIEQERRRAMSPEDRAYEENKEMIETFRKQFEQAQKRGAYQPGQEFDSNRNQFIEKAAQWTESRSRLEAASLLQETIKWGVSKKGKKRLNDAVKQLQGSEN